VHIAISLVAVVNRFYAAATAASSAKARVPSVPWPIVKFTRYLQRILNSLSAAPVVFMLRDHVRISNFVALKTVTQVIVPKIFLIL
jgi:hypothetical protein